MAKVAEHYTDSPEYLPKHREVYHDKGRQSATRPHSICDPRLRRPVITIEEPMLDVMYSLPHQKKLRE